jgi:hypothetical protein
MDTYSPESLQSKDLVMIEVVIVRYRLFDDQKDNTLFSSKSKTRTQQWEKWRAQFKLRAVSLLAKAPKELQPEEPTEVLI